MKAIKLSVLVILSVAIFFACGDDKKKEDNKDDNKNNQEEVINEDDIEVEEIVEESVLGPVNLAEHNEEYPATITIPSSTPIVTLSFSGQFSGALEGEFSTNYLQIQIKDPYVFLNVYKGNFDLQFLKDSLMKRYDDEGAEIVDETESSFIFKKENSEGVAEYRMMAKKTVGEFVYFADPGFDVYNFDISEYVPYTLEDNQYMLDVFSTLTESVIEEIEEE